MFIVLPPDCSKERLTELVTRCEGRGWKAEASRGEEQIIVAVSGPPDVAALDGQLESEWGAEVLAVLSRREYRNKRWLRHLMQGIVAFLFVLVALGLGIPVLAFLDAPVEAQDTPDSVHGGTLEQLPENSARLVRLGETPVLVVRVGGMRTYALLAACTHMDTCLLEWSSERRQVLCPCHGCAFDVYGNVVQGPASIPLRSFGAEWIGDDVMVTR